MWKGQELSSGRIVVMNAREQCEVFAACGYRQRKRMWVEYLYDMIDQHALSVPPDLAMDVAGVMMRLRLDRTFSGRKHTWIVYDLGTDMRGLQKLGL